MASGEAAEEAPGHPGILRLTAPNPGPMTLSGTNTYVVGADPAWVIDPGPADEGHIARVRAAAEARGGIGGVVLTHSHRDHNEGVEMLGAGLAFGNPEGFDDLAALMASGPIELPSTPASELGTDVGPLRAYATAGHATDHVVFVHGDACFCGDLILGEGSSIVPPRAGGGSLADYMTSLDLVADLAPALLCPGHGPWITEPAERIAAYAAHRRERERLLVEALAADRREVDDLLDAAWGDVPEPMRPAAALAMRAHLEKLDDEGRLPGRVTDELWPSA